MNRKTHYNLIRTLVRSVLLEEDDKDDTFTGETPRLYQKPDGSTVYVYQQSDFKNLDFKIPDFSSMELEQSEDAALSPTQTVVSAWQVLDNPSSYKVKPGNWNSDKRPGFTTKPVAHPRKKNPNGTAVMQYHKGMDISFSAGLTEAMPAVAVADGTVTIQAATTAELEGAEGAGNFVVLDLGGGIKVRYLHLALFSVNTGDKVNRGGKLGMLGQTGSPDSPHLHFEVYENSVAVDPMRYLTDTSKNWAFPAAVMR